jgi:hypothetical protein
LGQDECFNVEAIRWIREHLETSDSDVFWFPRREYIMGRHDERAYYWPEFQPRAWRRGKIEMATTLHAYPTMLTSKIYNVPISSGACIHHLSHKDVHGWIEKTNRYTSAPDRHSTFEDDGSLEAFSRERISFWLAQSKANDEYVTACALLRAVYDIVDRLKRWETSNNLDGEREFASICAELQASYDELGLPKK